MAPSLIGPIGVPTIVPGVTIAELLTDAGGTGQTRTIIDPTYPGANGGVTWVTSDPLSGTDPGGKARYWARYPDGSGNFWRRDDWNALTVGVGAANAISLDWIGLDESEDASIVFQELMDQYIDGAAGNVLSIKGPEDVSEIIVGGIAKTGDGSASAWYWYRPTTNRCTIRPKPWTLGTEDLNAKTWTNLGSDRWSTSVGETVMGLRACDPSFQRTESTNTTKGPWLAALNLQADAASVNAPREWFFGSGTLTVSATSDPSTYFAAGTSATTAAMQYFTNMDDTDQHGHFTNFHTVYIEGGASFFHTEFGIHSQGRAGPDPWGGAQGIVVSSGWVFEYLNASFVDAGSSFTFLMGLSQYLFDGLTFVATPADHQNIDKVTIGGLSSTQVLPYQNGATSIASQWWHWHKGDSAGEAYRNHRLWGETSHGWDGAISISGATNDVGGRNISEGRTWPFARNRRLNNFHKVTGHASGYGGMPFTGVKGQVQIGESLADPYKWELVQDIFGIAGDYATYAPNGRPVYFDDNASASIQWDKADVFNCVRGGTNFMWIENLGAVDPFTGASVNVDVRDSVSTDVLNVEADPSALDLGLRNATTSFEATVPEQSGGYAGLDLKLSGVGQGVIVFSEVDPRFPYNWSGYFTIHGINDAFHMRLDGLQENTTVTDFTFADMFSSSIHNPEVGISIHSETYFSKPDNVTIQDCTLQGNRTIRIGNGQQTPPYRVFLADLTITGDANRTAIDIDPFTAGNFNEGRPIVIQANNVTNWDDGIKVDIPDAEHGNDVYFSDNAGTTWYQVPYFVGEVGGSNVTKSAPPNLVTLNSAHRTFNAATADIYTPQFFHNGNHCIVVLWFDGDPGTFTETSGFSAIAGASANLSDNSLYVRAFERSYTTGTDCWDESLITGSNHDSIRKTFTWTTSRMGWGYSIENTGQNATPIGNVGSTAHNTAGTSHTAPTITTTTDSKIMSFVGMPGNGLISAFGGTLSPWMGEGVKSGGLFGRRGNQGYQFDPGGLFGTPNNSGVGIDMSYAAASIYAGTGGSKAGCQYTLDTSLKAITTSIEIKT